MEIIALFCERDDFFLASLSPIFMKVSVLCVRVSEVVRKAASVTALNPCVSLGSRDPL